VRRLNQLDKENSNRQRLVADLSLEDAWIKIGNWRRLFNKARPQSAPDWMTPNEFASQHGFKPVLAGKKENLTSRR
jgi:hypothetical protein